MADGRMREEPEGNSVRWGAIKCCFFFISNKACALSTTITSQFYGGLQCTTQNSVQRIENLINQLINLKHQQDSVKQQVLLHKTKNTKATCYTVKPTNTTKPSAQNLEHGPNLLTQTKSSIQNLKYRQNILTQTNLSSTQNLEHKRNLAVLVFISFVLQVLFVYRVLYVFYRDRGAGGRGGTCPPPPPQYF